MTKRVPCPPAPGLLEDYAARFDDLFSALGQRRGFREYLAGLLAPRDRNKTLTCLAGAEPVAGAQQAAVQRLQYFLTESVWDPDAVNARRLEVLLADPRTVPHAGGVLVIDDSGDRKDGTATAYAGRQWLGRYGKTDNGVVTVSTLWADEQLYYPLHAQPYTPARRLPGGTSDPGFRTKPRIAAQLAAQAARAGVAFRAAVADCVYGDHDGLRAELRAAGLPFVLALRPTRGVWAYQAEAYTPRDAARALAWGGPEGPGDWRLVRRAFRDGHTRIWWAAEARLGAWGPDGATRLVVATTDPHTLPAKTTWYLATNLPRPGGKHRSDSAHRVADLGEIVRLYGLRNWIEQGYKQVKDELGWADFQVRSATAIRRHQSLVHCAFSFCWATRPCDQPPPASTLADEESVTPRTDAEERGTRPGPAELAPGAADRPLLADPCHHAATMVASLVHNAPAGPTARPDRHGQHRPRPTPLHPTLI